MSESSNSGKIQPSTTVESRETGLSSEMHELSPPKSERSPLESSAATQPTSGDTAPQHIQTTAENTGSKTPCTQEEIDTGNCQNQQ